jgi:Tol biopolymer transport system component
LLVVKDADRPAPLANGTLVGPYEIVGWLGAGGMGVVYRARDPRLGRDIAIKLIPDTLATDATRLHRFEQEARAAGQLNHSNVLAVYDVGTHAGAPYIVSELLEGESLRSRLERGALPSRKALHYARQIAEGLAAAHDRGIVHRDVKPDNLFITNDDRVKILDFGIAKLTRPGDEAGAHTGVPTETGAGMVIGTAGYMSPEQVRGEPVDARSDIFNFGIVLYEMLSGRPSFARGTAAETMAAILKEDPAAPLPKHVPPAVERIVTRCLEKTRDARFQSAHDLAFGLEFLSGTTDTAPPGAVRAILPRWQIAASVAVVLTLLAAGASWMMWRPTPPLENLLSNAKFTRFTDWEGTEGAPVISPDGRFVAFLADRAGEFDLWVSQVGTGHFVNLTKDLGPLGTPGNLLRPIGFSADGSEIWFGVLGDPGERKVLIPLTGGTPRPFVDTGISAPAWSPDGNRLVFFTNTDGDPFSTADRTGADARPIVVDTQDGGTGVFGHGMHNHNPVWSPDGQWIYFVHGRQLADEMNIWRVRPSGESAEQLTQLKATANFLAPIDDRTLLYIAPAADRSGPWLWALDVERKLTRRVTTGLDRYTSVSASGDGRRVVATAANVVTNLWKVPVSERVAEESDVESYPVQTTRALAPRFGGTNLFYVSSQGAGDGLWRFHGGQATEVWKSADSTLSEPPAVSPDGQRVAIAVGQDAKRRLVVMSADGTNSRTWARAIDVRGSGGQGALDWSPDGESIVIAGADPEGPGLFRIPVSGDGGDPVRLVSGDALNPVWSPDGKLIVYAGTTVGGRVPLRGVDPAGRPVALHEIQGRVGGGYRFLPDGRLVFLPHNQALDFWLADLRSKTNRPLTRLANRGALRTFDISPDGKHIVFDRSHQNSDIHLIELVK